MKSKYGILKGIKIEDGVCKVRDLVEKPKVQEAMYSYGFEGKRYDVEEVYNK